MAENYKIIYKEGTGELVEKKVPVYCPDPSGKVRGRSTGLCRRDQKEILGCKAQLQCLCYRKETGADQMLG